MTPEENNIVRSQGRKCVAEIQQALKCRPKPKWNAVVPPIIKKHHEVISVLGVSLIEFNSVIGPHAGALRCRIMTKLSQIIRELRAPFLLVSLTINQQFRE